jgi:hypothetical protein
MWMLHYFRQDGRTPSVTARSKATWQPRNVRNIKNANKKHKKPQNPMPKLDDAITYEIFKILAKDPNSTQRALAKSLGVSLGKLNRRNLTKINYRIHTDAIKQKLIPATLSKKQISHIYATEADILNMALFGKTAAQWRAEKPDATGNIRDFANVSQLVCLANLENLNAVFINEGMEQSERLTRLNQIAIQQMKILVKDKSTKKLEE